MEKCIHTWAIAETYHREVIEKTTYVFFCTKCLKIIQKTFRDYQEYTESGKR